MTTDRDRLTEAMQQCACRGAMFIGQAIAYPGTGMTATFAGFSREQLLELPVFENTQLGMAIGMSLAMRRPVVAVYPRINFLMCAMDQLVLHLDALPRYSGYRPRVIIRTAVATPEPLDPGPQHLGDYTVAIRSMLQAVHVERLNRPSVIHQAYQDALEREGSSLLVEYSSMYEDAE